MKIKTYTIEKNVRDNIKVWGAIIVGLHPKYNFNRVFSSYRYLNDCSSKHAYYDYYIDVEENQIIEIGIKSQYKNKRLYYHLNNGQFVCIKQEDVVRILNEQEVA